MTMTMIRLLFSLVIILVGFTPNANTLLVVGWVLPFRTNNKNMHSSISKNAISRNGKSIQQQQQRKIVSASAALFMSIPNPLDVATSGLVSICRYPRGVNVLGTPMITTMNNTLLLPKIKVLYDIENNFNCRKVREVITELDLVIENVIPSTPNSRVFQNQTTTSTSSSISNNNNNNKFTLPIGTEIPTMIVTENGIDDMMISGVDDILDYFNEKFQFDSRRKKMMMTSTSSSVNDNGDDDSLSFDTPASIADNLREVGGYVSFLLRIGRGTLVAPTGLGDDTPRPTQPLVLYSYEGNQFCRLVREVLTELDLVYELRCTGKGSVRRMELQTMTGGSSICPYLLDPNTDVAMSESLDIIKYLYKTYGKWIPPNEILQWASDNVLPLAKPIYKVITPLQAGSSDETSYTTSMNLAKDMVMKEITSHPVVVYTYQLSPFSYETKTLLDSLNISYKEISLGLEWIPGLIDNQNMGSEKRNVLLELTGQSSLPQTFIGGMSIGGLFSGQPGLVPALEQGILLEKVQAASTTVKTIAPADATISTPFGGGSTTTSSTIDTVKVNAESS